MPGANASAESASFSYRPGWYLALGIVLASIAEAFAGTILALGRIDLLGDTHATPDQFAWLDMSYTIAKFLAFVLTPWLVDTVAPQT